MTTYTTEEFINSILENSFKEKHYVDRSQLNRIAYQTAREIFIQTGQKIIDERFEVNFHGPALRSVNSHYLQVHDNRTIQKYMESVYERPRFINDSTIEKIIVQMWNKTKYMPLSSALLSVPTINHPLLNDSGNVLLLAG